MNRSLKLLLLLLISGFLLNIAKAQENSEYFDSTIVVLFNTISGSVDDSEKELLSDSLALVVERYLSEDFPFKNKINGGRYLGQIYAPDSLVKLFSWNIAFQDGSNRYTTFIVRKSDDNKRVWKVDSRQGINLVKTDTEICYSDWYGSLYYDIRSFSNRDKTLYLLLGLDMNGFFSHGKVIDILRFNEKDEPVFGAPVILAGNTIQHRLIFKYSAQVSMLLRYDVDSERVVFDHLSPASPKFVGDYQYYGPDFSYDALEFRDGLWRLLEDIDLRNKE